jgi:DNA excision repair protein ERCC-4
VVPSSGIGHPSHGLSAVQPHFVCVLDPDVATVRQLEVFKALHPGFPLRVYFFVYAESVEEERYRATLRREQDAFYALIQEKASLVFPQLPSTLSSASSSSSSLMMSGAPLPLSMRNADTFSSSASTNTTTTGKEQRIIIDLREFRSQLPALLHAEPQTTIVPVTLLVGDYILSPELCVERKALSDLVQSLGSGRLHAQAEAMERSYKTPLLLIEFDASRPFGLSSAADLADRDLSCTHTLAKVAILTMHHPRLRLLWARTPHSSVRLLLALKTHHEQPNAQDAIAKGDDDLLPAATCRSVGDLTADAAAADSSTTGGPVTTAIDVLRKLPGVTPHNVRTLVQRWDALADLCAARRDELCEALGAQNGGKLWDFLHKGE